MPCVPAGLKGPSHAYLVIHAETLRGKTTPNKESNTQLLVVRRSRAYGAGGNAQLVWCSRACGVQATGGDISLPAGEHPHLRTPTPTHLRTPHPPTADCSSVTIVPRY